jgi:hypothetical protein
LLSLVQFEKASFPVEESESEVSIQLIRTGGISGSLECSLQVTATNALAGVDYDLILSNVTFGPLETAKSFPIRTHDNLIPEFDKTLTLRLAAASSSNLVLGRRLN